MSSSAEGRRRHLRPLQYLMRSRNRRGTPGVIGPKRCVQTVLTRAQRMMHPPANIRWAAAGVSMLPGGEEVS
jgi:hypothetical protein